MNFDALSSPLSRRLRDGFDRIALALKTDQWTCAEAFGVTPSQAHVLTFLAGRGGAGIRVRVIAEHLGVTQPTATDSINALARKGLIAKEHDPTDARAVTVRISPAGADVVRMIGLATLPTEEAFGSLSLDEQTDLLQLLMKVIRALQDAGAIPTQRMCVTCRYFHPHVHESADKPHHCAYVDAAFGPRHLRVDCAEHVDAAGQTASNPFSVADRAGPPR